jgi:hypothetical protein
MSSFSSFPLQQQQASNCLNVMMFLSFNQLLTNAPMQITCAIKMNEALQMN